MADYHSWEAEKKKKNVGVKAPELGDSRSRYIYRQANNTPSLTHARNVYMCNIPGCRSNYTIKSGGESDAAEVYRLRGSGAPRPLHHWPAAVSTSQLIVAQNRGSRRQLFGCGLKWEEG